MRVDLVELLPLLRTRRIVYPPIFHFVLMEAKAEPGKLRLKFSGFPWWREDPKVDGDEEIIFHFEGVGEGNLDFELLRPEEYESLCEILEALKVRRLSECDWAKGPACSVYCSAPLPKPMQLYGRVQDELVSMDCPYGPENYLNLGHSGSVSEFLQITTSRSLLLCHGPETVCQRVCSILDDIGVRWNLVKNENSPWPGLCGDDVYFRFGASWLLCEAAYAWIGN